MSFGPPTARSGRYWRLSSAAGGGQVLVFCWAGRGPFPSTRPLSQHLSPRRVSSPPAGPLSILFLLLRVSLQVCVWVCGDFAVAQSEGGWTGGYVVAGARRTRIGWGSGVSLEGGLWHADSDSHRLCLVGRLLASLVPRFEVFSTSI
ncbi:hypothetical protein Salat_0166700 [Sesamum alatum]|uniref:Uncharacterized protein n=1 Tax=Sesamum alatum TaxID=300844 RepID=A0AAE1YXX1_9LAMI|nr:hypothetical protein Salat_0166700 [Sesamum alatum]